MLKLDAQTTALVLIDLQNGILPYAGGPHSADQVVANAALLAARFRLLGAPVLLVRVGWSDSFAEALKQPVDKPAPAPAGGLPASWWNSRAAGGLRQRYSGHQAPMGRLLRHRSGFAAAPSRHQIRGIGWHIHQYRRGIHRPRRLGAWL